MVSHDTRDLMVVLITWEKELHLSNKRFIAVYGFCIKICDSKSDKFQSKAIQKVYRLDIRFNYFVTKVLNDFLMKTSHVKKILQNEFSSHRLAHLNLKFM